MADSPVGFPFEVVCASRRTAWRSHLRQHRTTILGYSVLTPTRWCPASSLAGAHLPIMGAWKRLHL